jgi:ArsR family transcriptional regulator, lead/cadmium/zinc/bismuth-responsive transcriptional repressor
MFMKVDPMSETVTVEREAAGVAEFFRLMGDPTRVRILYTLQQAGELCVGDLSLVVGMSETAVSHALRLLRTAGIVKRRRASRMAYYSLDDAHVANLLDLSREHLRHSLGEARRGA